MLLSKDAIADVAETVRGVDFYRPAHEVIHDAIIDLYGRGEPADPVTVAAELQRRGELQRVGGAPYLHTLSANVPIAANAGYYAEIVREKAILRRLVDAGTKIVQIGYAGEGQVDDVVDQAQAEVYKITDRRSAEDYAPLSDIMDGVLDEIEAIGNREAGLYGVPTGFADLDDLTNGLHAGQMVIVAARPAMGKALALDTPLPTRAGWTTMGEVAVGDELRRRRGPTDPGGGRDRGDARPAVLRGVLLRRVDDRRRCGAPVADDSAPCSGVGAARAPNTGGSHHRAAAPRPSADLAHHRHARRVGGEGRVSVTAGRLRAGALRAGRQSPTTSTSPVTR